MDTVTQWLNDAAVQVQGDPSAYAEALSYVVYMMRGILPVLAFLILYRCIRSFLRERYAPEIWAYFVFPDDSRIPIRHWECIIGRTKSSDVVLNAPTVSRSHAAVLRDETGMWCVYDLRSKGGVYVNGLPVSEAGAQIKDGDLLSFAGEELTFLALTEEEQMAFNASRNAPGRYVHPGKTFFMLTVFITLLTLVHTITADPQYVSIVTFGFCALILLMWLYYLVMRSIRRMGFEIETIAFFLSALGFSVVATSAPQDMLKQVAFLVAGLFLYLFLGFWIRDLNRAKKLRWAAGGIAIVLLAMNLVLAQEVFGAKNWISLFGFQFQPSEFVKILYIYAGTATLDRLYMGRNLILYIAFSAICVGALALMGDFGTALIFFMTFLIISYMRSGNLATVFLAISGAGLAGMLMFTIKPYIAKRFETWGHVWEFAYAGGYQQTRALSAAASGGMFGQGAGRGWMHQIVAADTDLVFGVLSEELGLIIAMIAVLSIIVLAVFAVHSATHGRSSFYVIASCAAVSMMMVQLALNVFGCVDILPFTGVTFPFVSKGGSSFIACWALLSFIKSADTRKNASFTTKIYSRKKLFRMQKEAAYPEEDMLYEEVEDIEEE